MHPIAIVDALVTPDRLRQFYQKNSELLETYYRRTVANCAMRLRQKEKALANPYLAFRLPMRAIREPKLD